MTDTQAPQAAQAKTRPDYIDRIQTVLNTIIHSGRFDLRVTISPAPSSPNDPDAPEWAVLFSGRDSELVVESHAALLDAFASIACKAARLDEGLAKRIFFDCEGYRSARANELRLMAEMAANRAEETHGSFALSPMNAAERRLIHLALRDNARVRTESEGTGPERKVVIHPAQH